MSELDEHQATSLHCTNCRQTVVVRINKHATGNLTITCPKCEHEHYRYCEDGVITEDRWKSSAPMILLSSYSASATSDTTTYSTSAGGFIQDAWYNTGTANW